MAPACILLDRLVTFRDHPQETEPFDISIGERAKPVVGATTAELPTLPSREETEASIGSSLLAMTPDLEAVEPPEVSRLTMQRPLSSAPIRNLGWPLRGGAMVAAADKNLVVLYAGSYYPASYAFNRWYLLLDHDKDASSSSSLSAIPGIRYEYSYIYKSPGHGAVIMTREGGAFVLADLLFDLPGRWGLLCLWQSSICSWVYKHGQLPAEAPQLHACRIHMAFPVQSRNRNLFCWVDLLHGLLLWDLGTQCKVDSSGLLDMSFVPLPYGCSVSKDHPKLRNPEEFRNAACVDGTIKFITMDGFMKGAPISLITYTLDLDDPSHPSWMTDTKLLLQDLWVDKTFISNDVPKITPWFPILSTLEHDIVYLVIPGDREREEGCSFRGVKLVLSVDMRKTRVISATQPKHPRPLLRWRYLFATSVSRSQWGSKYHQGAVEAIEMGPSGKRMKV